VVSEFRLSGIVSPGKPPRGPSKHPSTPPSSREAFERQNDRKMVKGFAGPRGTLPTRCCTGEPASGGVGRHTTCWSARRAGLVIGGQFGCRFLVDRRRSFGRRGDKHISTDGFAASVRCSADKRVGTHCRFPAKSAGQHRTQGRVSVEYSTPCNGLHTDLFVSSPAIWDARAARRRKGTRWNPRWGLPHCHQGQLPDQPFPACSWRTTTAGDLGAHGDY